MAHDDRAMVSVRDLRKYFGPIKAVDGFDLEVGAGEVVVIVGPSGSGKSTVLRCINHLEKPTGGEVWVDGHLVGHGATDINAVRREVGMVFQQFNLFPHLTVLRNVTIALELVRKMKKDEAREVGLEQLTRVGIRDKADAYPRQLSGGQQQRVAIARALAMNPKVILFDEPTSALDPEMINEVLDVMLDLARGGMTMVVVTHEMGFARAAANKVVVIDEGKLVESGPPEEIFERPTQERTQLFFSKILSH